jgi:hypothetical protein
MAPMDAKLPAASATATPIFDRLNIETPVSVTDGPANPSTQKFTCFAGGADRNPDRVMCDSIVTKAMPTPPNWLNLKVNSSSTFARNSPATQPSKAEIVYPAGT